MIKPWRAGPPGRAGARPPQSLGGPHPAPRPVTIRAWRRADRPRSVSRRRGPGGNVFDDQPDEQPTPSLGPHHPPARKAASPGPLSGRAAPDPRRDPDHLGLGLRTYYRELELLKRCGVKVRHKEKQYTLMSTAEQAEGRLPFPDPQLSFAEMADLANCSCEAGKRLAELLASVINQPVPAKPSGGWPGPQVAAGLSRPPLCLRMAAACTVQRGNDRAGTRTQDQRINLPHRLSPTTSRGRPQAIRNRGVESLDYPIAIAGVPRLVSGAGADDPPVPCLLITQSPRFSDHHARRYRPRCGGGALRASQHTAASTRRGSVSSRERLLCIDSLRCLKSVALPTELPGLELSKTLPEISSESLSVQPALDDPRPMPTLRQRFIPWKSHPRPCYVRTSGMARHVVFPTPEVPIMSGIAMVRRAARWSIVGSVLALVLAVPAWAQTDVAQPRARYIPAEGLAAPSSTPASTPTPGPGRVPPFLQDAQRDLARGDARGHSQPGCRPGLSRCALGTAHRQGVSLPCSRTS